MPVDTALTRFVDRHADDLWLWSRLKSVPAESVGMTCLRKCSNRDDE